MKTLMIIAALTLGGLTATTASAQQKAQNNTEKIYAFKDLDTAPSYPGGMEAFYKYLQASLKYPKQAKDKKIQGKVFLAFTVEKDGRLNDVKVEKGLGGGTDEEALRVVKASPKWIPGQISGKAVRVKYQIPISFSMAGK